MLSLKYLFFCNNNIKLVFFNKNLKISLIFYVFQSKLSSAYWKISYKNVKPRINSNKSRLTDNHRKRRFINKIIN